MEKSFCNSKKVSLVGDGAVTRTVAKRAAFRNSHGSKVVFPMSGMTCLGGDVTSLQHMPRKTTVLFIQLPQLDNDTSGAHENMMMAASCLQYAVEQSSEAPYHRFARLPDSVANADNACTVELIKQIRPGVIAFTLYLWNIERSLRLARAVRQCLPRARIVVGGPEVAFPHPFLFRCRIVDVAVAGEGEAVFPFVLRAFRKSQSIDFRTIATRTTTGYRMGRLPPPPVDLNHIAPPAGYRDFRPDRHGMAYIETTRGCPMRCAYCRYPQMRQQMSFLDPDGVIARIRSLRKMGGREIRFVDPSFNAHPAFTPILRGLAALNRSHSLKFFAEVNAERLTGEQANLLAKANFTDIEVGMQSRDKRVLGAILRPSDLERLDAGVRLLCRRKIRVTLDVMYGLPLQSEADVRRSLRHALGFRGINVQSLQTLLIPGTELRRRRREWGLEATPLPPYGVTSTPLLPPGTLVRIESYVSRHPRLRSDLPTPRFVGLRLAHFFPERILIRADHIAASASVRGCENRRALIFRGDSLFGRRIGIAGLIRRAIRSEPDILWQFVLEPSREEPIELFDELIAAIRFSPRHLNDRYASAACRNLISSRRILVRLRNPAVFSRGWQRTVEHVLASVFF